MTDRPPGASVAMYRLGGREYPLRSAQGCKTCDSPYRLDVEQQIAAGHSYASIVRGLPDDAGLTPANVRAHLVAGHLPLQVEALRRIAEDRADAIGRDVEAGVASLVDQVVLARTVVQRSFERIAAGAVEPEVADGIAAARLLHQMGVDDQQGDRDLWTEAFMVYHDVARRLMPPEMFERFGDELRASPILRGLQERHARRVRDEQLRGD